MSKTGSVKKQYRSMRGKQVDIDLLRKRNELTPAVGNARVNARGDELGPGGKIVKKREDIIAEHYAQAGKVRPSGDRNAVQETVTEEPAPAVEPVKTATRTTKKSATPAEVAAEEAALDAQEEWVEDENGNFVPKGE
jgi:hypothetical protein